MKTIKKIVNPFSLALSIFLLTQIFSSGNAQTSKEIKLNKEALKKLKDYPAYFQEWRHLGKIKLDSIRTFEKQKVLNLYFNGTLAYVPIRESYIDSIRTLIKKDLGKKFKKFDIDLYVQRTPLEAFIPNVYRQQVAKDTTRMEKSAIRSKPLVSNLSRPVFSKGLSNKNIALWHSHGWYYEARLDRWEWQRARLFGTVEDVSPMTYVLPFIAPMLENAGATTFIPRERDTRNQEIIVDNDHSTDQSECIIIQGKQPWKKSSGKDGFGIKDTLLNYENPFLTGSYLSIQTAPSDTAKIIYLPDFPEDGDYAVYISWKTLPGSTDAAQYTVFHAGGDTRFSINQQKGSGTWVYLGKFPFHKGKNIEKGRIEITNADKNSGIITADAVKFGGGMGHVARKPSEEYIAQQWSLAGGTNTALSAAKELKQADYKWKLSGKARYMEGARYFLQYSGMPRTVFSPNKGKNDYNDDYQSRGDWVNYLIGEHKDADRDSMKTGLNIPIDLSLAFHTDAGVVPKDSIIGTLAIYTTTYGDSIFPDGQSRMASRDLSDLIQTQIVADIRAQYNPKWTRRGLWDKAYSESWKPKVPSMLLELLSHQNLSDMKFSLDPRYRFTVSRAIYKGMLRFIAGQTGQEYVVQPLTPDHFAISIKENKRILLNWQAVSDTLEPTAKAKLYKVYTREGDLGFDNGVLTDKPFLEMELPKENVIYSFRITALNDGGESFPSETLSVCIGNNRKKPVLIVNAFDRICGPKIIDEGPFAGVAWWDDEGVPYVSDIGYIGEQYDFNRTTPWTDDDNPGWGSCYADKEGQVVPGNTFDFSCVHGKAIANAGYSFVSMSNEAFEQQLPNGNDYSAVDVIFGEQRSTPGYIDPGKKDFVVYTPGMIQALKQLTEAGIPLFISGAYVGTDMAENKDSVAIRFAKDYLHYTWRTNHADNTGQLRLTDWAPEGFPQSVSYNASYNPGLYKVEAPDGIEPAGNDAVALFRYSSNNISAGICNKGKNKTVVLGFPFETITKESERNELMKAILTTFEK